MAKNEITPERAKALIKALRANPNLTDAADTCGIHPRVLTAAIKRGMFPNPDPQDRALAKAARHSRALLRGELFETLRNAAKDDPKWAQYLLEHMTDPDEVRWSETLPGPQDAAAIRQHLFRPGHVPPDLLADVHAAGMKLVPLTAEEKMLPAPVADGEFEDEDDDE